MDIGMDSLLAVEFRTRLTSELAVPLHTTLVFDYPTIGAISDYIVAQHTTGQEVQPRKDEPTTTVIS
jgi:acyl carrier protein